jgi:hypothetical protein
MKRMLLILAAAALFLNAVVLPSPARADGPGPNCPPGQMCKP